MLFLHESTAYFSMCVSLSLSRVSLSEIKFVAKTEKIELWVFLNPTWIVAVKLEEEMFFVDQRDN